MIRLLFVDDDPNVLAGIRRMLHRERQHWDMVFAEGGANAMSALEASSFDVVVSDMRMPGTDGVEVLRHTRERHPHAARIVLSGHTDVAAAARSIPLAHQFLSKPCDPETLKQTVRRACRLQGRLHTGPLRQVIGAIEALPSAPHTLVALNEALERSDTSISAVVEVIAADPAISAKLLQLVNSAFFGLPKRVTALPDAVSYLGVNNIRNLASAVEAFRQFGGVGDASLGKALHQHSLTVANVARELVASSPAASEVFAAALLHDIGFLVLAAKLPRQLTELLAKVRGGQLIEEAELEVVGATHADIGAYLLSLWGLPFPIVETAALHHDATSLDRPRLDAVHATHVASRLVHADHPIARNHNPPPLDPAYLNALGITGLVARWSARADDLGRHSAGQSDTASGGGPTHSAELPIAKHDETDS